jgi:hypothetical protein
MHRSERIPGIIEAATIIGAVVAFIASPGELFFIGFALFAIYLALVRCAGHLAALTRSASSPGPSRTSRPGSPPEA